MSRSNSSLETATLSSQQDSRPEVSSKRSYDDYTVGWICALPVEWAAATCMLDERHPKLQAVSGDDNTYCFGSMGEHNVVVACLPSGSVGTARAERVATDMRRTFKSLRFGLLVGIGGGVPSQHDIRLGDVVINKPSGTSAGVIQYDFGKTIRDGRFILTGSLAGSPHVLSTAVTNLEGKHMSVNNHIQEHMSTMIQRYPKMQSEFVYQGDENDQLFAADYEHIGEGSTCENCDASQIIRREPRRGHKPKIFYGIIATANQVMKHAITRDQIGQQLEALCFEMEAGGLMDSFPCLVIRGICDYSDSHKNKRWQPYAAATAAACAKELLCDIATEGRNKTRTAREGDTNNMDMELSPLDEKRSVSQSVNHRHIPGPDISTGSLVLVPPSPIRQQYSPLASLKAKIKGTSRKLIAAANDGDLDTLRQCLDDGALRSQLDQITIDRALIAVSRAEEGKEEHVRAIRLLVSHGAGIECKDDKHGRTPLIWAVIIGRGELIDVILQNHASVEERDKKETWTPIMWAVYMARDAITQKLIDKGANLESTDGHWRRTPLLMAVTYGHKDTAEMLLQENRTALEVKDKKELTPLGAAYVAKDKQLAEMLLRYGANPNFRFEDGMPLLIHAVIENDEDFVKLLVELGDDKDGRGALLLEATDHTGGRTALLWAVGLALTGVIKLLLSRGASVTAKDEQGRSVLDVAELNGDQEIIMLVSARR